MEHEHPLELARIDAARETPVRATVARAADANEPPAAPTAPAKEGDG
jgi:hypothetical protein